MMFSYFHGVDGLIRNEDDHKQVQPMKIIHTYKVDIFHPEIIQVSEESVIDQIYKVQIHDLPKPSWLLSIS